MNTIQYTDPLAAFGDWRPSERRACDCGSFSVEEARCAPNGIEAIMFRCEDCGRQWTEPEMVF